MTQSKGKNKKGKIASILFQTSIYLYPLLLFVIFWIGTNLNSIVMAFQNISIDGARTFVGFENFKSFVLKIFAGTQGNAILKTSVLNSLKMFFVNFCVCMPLYLLFSYYLFKKLPASKLYVILIMLPSIVSGFMYSMIFRRLVNALPSLIKDFPHLLSHPDYCFGTMLFFMIWISFATSLIVYPNAMRGISTEILEAGRIDGTTWSTEFWYIIFPLMFPTISTFIVTGVAAIFTNAGPAVEFYKYDAPAEVYTVGYYYIAMVMKATTETGYPELAAGGLLLTLITCPLTFLVRWLCEKFAPETE